MGGSAAHPLSASAAADRPSHPLCRCAVRGHRISRTRSSPACAAAPARTDSAHPFYIVCSCPAPYVCLTLLCNIQSFHFVNKTFEKICISWKAPPEDISGGAFWYTIWEESYLVQPHLIGILHKLQAFPQQRQLPAVSCRHGTAGPTIHHIPLYRLPF